VPDAAGGFFLFLFESFVARALLGSLVAALLVEAMLRRNAVRGVRGRRLLLLVPFSVAALLAVASLNRGFLPAIWFDTDPITSPAPLIEVLGDIQIIGGTVNLVVAGYLLIVGALVTRRLAGFVATTRLRAQSAMASPAIRRRALRIAIASGITPPEVRLRPDCPGGAFTTGVRRPWIALDPGLVTTLDDDEIDALLAHEMAHIRLRDPMLCLLTGVCRDLVFFLPGIHLASLWLRREQEEVADDRAAGCTHRPGALASSILKVWEAQAGRMRLASACAAVTPARPWRSLLPAWRSHRDVGQPHVLVRVQRLITPLAVSAQPSPRRELGLPFTVLMLAVTIGVLIPAWTTRVFDNDGLLLRVFSSSVAAQIESPAFATFRALAPREARPQPVVSTLPADDVDPLCPCVESPAELRAGRSAGATATSSQLVWSSDGRDAWELHRLHEQARLRVNRNLLSWRGGQQEVGFFTVSRNPVAPPAAVSRSHW
jgi:Zn-dependent protease with chaperone function